MSREVWLSVCYTGDFTLRNGVFSWEFDGGIERGKVIPFPVPKKITYMDLYRKLIEKLRIDSSMYDMVLRCLLPSENKDLVYSMPYSIFDDDSVDWLLSCCDKTRLCITLKLKTVNDDAIGGNEEVNEPNRDEVISEKIGDDTACLLIGVGVGVDGLGEMDNNVVNFDDSVDDTEPTCEAAEALHQNYMGIDSEMPTFEEAEVLQQQHSSRTEDGQGGGDPLLDDGAWLANESTANQILVVHGNQSISWFIPEVEDVKVNDIFDSKDYLKEKLQVVALKHHFEFKTNKSDNKRYVVTCKTELCNWRLLATTLGASKVFVVRKYQRRHCCPRSLPNRFHKHASSKLIGKFLAPNFQDPSHVSKPKDVIRDFAKEYGYELKYCTAYKAQKHGKELIRGNPADSYKELPKFFHLLEEHNPGTITFIENNDENEFEYCFMALGQSIRGFPSMRQVICVDGTFFKGKKGTLLVATCQDGNYQIYPLAFAVVNAETNKSWTWFFEKLIKITGDTRELAIISDRSERIIHGFKQIYKNACHGHCTYHLKRNVKSHFPRLDIDFLFTRASKAYTVWVFKKHFDGLCLKREGIRDYLDPKNFWYWSRAHFDGLRYNIMTTNIVEALNGLLLKQREFPVVGLLKAICDILQRWFAERRVEANEWGSTLTPKIEKKILKRLDKMVSLNPVVLVIRHPHQFEVCIGGSIRNIVDLEAGKCTCRKFDMHRFPCVHALAAAKKVEIQPYQLCTKYYYTSLWRVAYSESILPFPNEDEFEYPEHVLNRTVLKPKWANRQVGRPEMNRKKSAGEVRDPGEARKERKRRRRNEKQQVDETGEMRNEQQGVDTFDMDNEQRGVDTLDTDNVQQGTKTIMVMTRARGPGDSDDEIPKKMRSVLDFY